MIVEYDKIFLCICLLSSLLVGITSGKSDKNEEKIRKPRGILFNHLPKAGGEVIREIIKNSLTSHSPIKIVTELETSTKEDQEEYFVIGSVRAPCSYYGSLYFYGRNLGKGARFHHTNSEPWYNESITTEKEGFILFTYASLGILQKRFILSYPDLAVDCWVRQELLIADLTRCFEQYKVQEKPINFTIDNMKVEETLSRGIHSAPHTPCREMVPINSGLEKTIMKAEDHIWFNFPEYKNDCCGDRLKSLAEAES